MFLLDQMRILLTPGIDLLITLVAEMNRKWPPWRLKIEFSPLIHTDDITLNHLEGERDGG